MSDLGKKNHAADGDTIESIKQQLDECVAEIRKDLANKPDMQDIDSGIKQKLSREYLRASQLAKKLSQRHTDIKQSEYYADLYEKLKKRATDFGSTVSSKTATHTFDDIKGLEDVKKIVKSFMFLSQNQDLLNYYKIEGGLGMMLYGAPGTGKTMFAEAVANALNLPLFIVTPADIFSKYVGASEQAVRQIFDDIDACPDGAVLFVDECESIFSKRSEDTQDYKAAVTTELLQRLNGFGVSGSKRMIIAATNRPELIDPAYLRYKRFSHLVHVTPPDAEARRAIIEAKLDGIKLEGITVDEIADLTDCSTDRTSVLGEGVAASGDCYSGADISGIIEEACRLALEEIEARHMTMPIPLTREMFVKAFSKIKPSISAQVLKEYNSFR